MKTQSLTGALVLAASLQAHTVTIHVVNSAGVPDKVLSSAVGECSRIFHRSGIDITATERGEFTVYIVSERDVHTKQWLGVSSIPLKVSEVYAPMAHQIAHAYGLSDGEIIGAAIAHELGHQLFKSTQDGSTGLMRTWTNNEVLEIGKGQLSFTKNETKELRKIL